MGELFQAIRGASKTAAASHTEGKSVDLVDGWSLPGSRQFEVIHVTTVPTPATKTPVTFIDNVLNRHHYHQQLLQLQRQLKQVNTDTIPRRKSDSNVPTVTSSHNYKGHVNTGQGHSVPKQRKSLPEKSWPPKQKDFGGSPSLTFNDVITEEDIKQTTSITEQKVVKKTPAFEDEVVDNTSMLFLIGSSELRLISLNHKTIIMERAFKDISFCLKVPIKHAIFFFALKTISLITKSNESYVIFLQGVKHKDHFGFVSRQPSSGNFRCHIFRCSSEEVVSCTMCICNCYSCIYFTTIVGFLAAMVTVVDMLLLFSAAIVTVVDMLLNYAAGVL